MDKFEITANKTPVHPGETPWLLIRNDAANNRTAWYLTDEEIRELADVLDEHINDQNESKC